MKNNNLIAAIYYHPEAYPPTLNAISELSSVFDSIEIIYRPHIKGTWVYPENVTAIASGKYISARDQEKAPLHKKIFFFVQFVIDFFKSCKSKKPTCIVLYDSFPLLAYYLIKPFIRFEHKVWYHNHDVSEPEFLRKYSLGWFAYRTEKSFFKSLDIFSLPTDERLPYFDMKKFTGKYFCIPNYPSLKFYNQFYSPRIIDDEVKIIFQGRIGEGHGIEEIVPLLNQRILGYKLRLILKGFCDNSYRSIIEEKAKLYAVEERIEFYGFSPYKEVPKVASTCHIGIGIFAKKDIMNVTLGTASNKLYEYAACGLPVIYLQGSGIEKSLQKFSWALPVQLSASSIQKKIEEIIGQYLSLSEAAHASFCESLNFESHFSGAKAYVESVCKRA